MELAVSCVILALRPTPDGGGRTLWVPLVRRIREPFLGDWALPGGPLPRTATLEAAARASLRATTGLDPRYLEQLYAFGGLARGGHAAARSGEVDDDGGVGDGGAGDGGAGDGAAGDGGTGDGAAATAERVVSIVYWALVRAEEDSAAAAPENTRWFPVEDLPALAFDHGVILHYALERLRAKLGYSPIAHAFLPPEFTLAQLREVYEAVLGPTLPRPLDPANFRRQVLGRGEIEPTGRKLTGTSHRPPSLYRYRPQVVATSPTPPPRSPR